MAIAYIRGLRGALHELVTFGLRVVRRQPGVLSRNEFGAALGDESRSVDLTLVYEHAS